MVTGECIVTKNQTGPKLILSVIFRKIKKLGSWKLGLAIVALYANAASYRFFIFQIHGAKKEKIGYFRYFDSRSILAS